MRVTCISCNITYNCEDVAECIKCSASVCQECVLFECGNYYCTNCEVEKQTILTPNVEQPPKKIKKIKQLKTTKIDIIGKT